MEVRTHDFMDRDLGKVNPYGVYYQTTNTGWVSVGTALIIVPAKT